MYQRHEFLAQAARIYKACEDCNKRTPHVCIKCGYCYSCHPKIERPLKQEGRTSVAALGGLMGRTIPSLRLAPAEEQAEWSQYRKMPWQER